MFYKNTAGQKLSVFAYDSTTGDPVTGGSANITAQISLNGAASAATNDTNPTELDATDHPGIYIFDMTQAETNANLINLTAVSATANVLLEPVIVYTEPATRDANLIQILGTALTETVGGYLAAAFKKLFDVATPVFTAASVNQTGDSYARIGATGSGLTSLAPSATALSTATWTGTLATNIGTTNTTVATNLDAAVSSRGTSTLTQTQVTGGAYALNSSSFAFNTAMDFTTAQKAATLARVTLVDTTTTNTDMRGTDNAALAAVWTSTLAAALAPIRSSTAQAGDSTTITLDASASAVTDFYVPCGIYLTGGTGAGQFRTIDDYNGTTKVATVSEPWYTTPDNTTTFAIRPEDVVHADMRALGGNELSAGYLKNIADYYGLNTKIPGHVESIATDAITADSLATDAVAEIQSGLASQTSVNDLPTSSELAIALAAADDAVLAAINALENLSAAEVNAEMLDVLNVDVFGELAAPPAASSTLRDKLTWIFMCHRNLRTETATQRKLYADNGSTLVGTEAVSDDGTTFTKGEVA